MEHLKGTVVSVHAGPKGPPTGARPEIIATLEGIINDQHFGFTRWSKTRKQVVRNERQWTALSTEEVEIIRGNMNLRELAADILKPNIVLEGIPDFSQLPRRTKLSFENGTLLIVEEFTDPCTPMGQRIADAYGTNADGDPIRANQFPKAANKHRGLVGVIEQPGVIQPGDTVQVIPYESKLGK